MVEAQDVAGRVYPRVYRVSGKSDIHELLVAAVERSGGRVLYASGPSRAPVYLGVQVGANERVGLLVYPFRCNPAPIGGRPIDEHRLQVRYGSEPSWSDDHPLGRDVANIDLTLVLGVHLEAGVMVGLDPLLYDPLPMGISVEFKDHHIESVIRDGWCVWERTNVAGVRRGQRRALEGLETLVAFSPDRLLTYARFERQASDLGLDPPLRLRAAETAFEAQRAPDLPHLLEEQFELSSQEILDIIDRRLRLHVAVRGGVAEAHLERHLRRDPGVVEVRPLDVDGEPDFDVVLSDGTTARIECKNCSPNSYADGTPRVEVQKTRASKGDPASRYYAAEHFEVLAACLYPVNGRWEFRFQRADQLEQHDAWPGRLRPMQRVEPSWTRRLPQLW